MCDVQHHHIDRADMERQQLKRQKKKKAVRYYLQSASVKERKKKTPERTCDRNLNFVGLTEIFPDFFPWFFFISGFRGTCKSNLTLVSPTHNARYRLKDKHILIKYNVPKNTHPFGDLFHPNWQLTANPGLKAYWKSIFCQSPATETTTVDAMWLCLCHGQQLNKHKQCDLPECDGGETGYWHRGQRTVRLIWSLDQRSAETGGTAQPRWIRGIWADMEADTFVPDCNCIKVIEKYHKIIHFLPERDAQHNSEQEKHKEGKKQQRHCVPSCWRSDLGHWAGYSRLCQLPSGKKRDSWTLNIWHLGASLQQVVRRQTSISSAQHPRK